MGSQGLTGKVALVTGAGSGLGQATAHALSSAGCAVACLDVRGDAADRVAAALAAAGGRATARRCDVADAEAVFATVADAVEGFGRLDIVVNCAGTDHVLPIDKLTVAQWDQIIGVNLRAAFLTAKAALPVMQRQRSGHIVNIASTAATRAWANAAAYHASKWGLVGFSRALGVEGRPYGIRSTTVIPGGMRTHFFDRFPEQGIPLPDEKNLQDPANVAQLILFAVQVPPESALQEVILTPLTETSWP
jgi:NAD(P)-dependent dehydrogenase (short-subunit alcohol dehydrogenase family)